MISTCPSVTRPSGAADNPSIFTGWAGCVGVLIFDGSGHILHSTFQVSMAVHCTCTALTHVDALRYVA